MNDSAASAAPVEKPTKPRKPLVTTKDVGIELVANILANSSHITNGEGGDRVSVPTKYAGLLAYIDIPANATVDIRSSTKPVGKMTAVKGASGIGATDVRLAHGELVVRVSGPRTIFHGDALSHAIVEVETQADDN